MKIKYKGSKGSGVSLDNGTYCPNGVFVDVADDIAARYLKDHPGLFESEAAKEKKVKVKIEKGGDE